MKAIKKFILEKVSFKEPKNVVNNNSLNSFLDTLTKEEKDGEFLDLEPAKQVAYVKAMSKLYIEAMGDISEATMKGLTMFAISLHKKNIDCFEFSQSFYGTKETLKEELFTIKLFKIDNATRLEKEKSMIEYADENAQEPKKKSENVIDQSDVVLEIIEKLKKDFSGDDLPRRVTELLLVAEFMSEYNVKDLNATLQGLMIKDVELNTSYKMEAVRHEIALDNKPPKHKM